jgi:hypothetical protein
MTTTIILRPEQTAESPAAAAFVASASIPWTQDAPAGTRIPLFMPRSQAYYWSIDWQVGELEALREIAEGDVRSFGSGAAAAEWLLKRDDA